MPKDLACPAVRPIADTTGHFDAQKERVAGAGRPRPINSSATGQKPETGARETPEKSLIFDHR